MEDQKAYGLNIKFTDSKNQYFFILYSRIMFNTKRNKKYHAHFLSFSCACA